DRVPKADAGFCVRLRMANCRRAFVGQHGDAPGPVSVRRNLPTIDGRPTDTDESLAATRYRGCDVPQAPVHGDGEVRPAFPERVPDRVEEVRIRMDVLERVELR